MKRFKQIFLCFSLLIVLFGCQKPVEDKSKEEPKKEVEEPKVPEVVKTSLTLSFVGDITLGNYAGQGYSGSFDQEYEKQGKDASYFLKNVKDVFEKDDLTIGNLEGPLTNEKSHAEKQFAFKGKPEYINILTQGDVEIVTLANNHSRDRFEKGMTDTKETLTNANIGYFGYEDSYIADVKGVKVGFLGYSFPQSFTTEMKEAITKLRKKADIVIVYFHWGIERDPSPMTMQRNIAKKCIDNGVDLVVGSHPHVLQGIETYKGKKIVYSLSNFCFGGNKNPSDKDSMIYQHTFNLEDNKIVSESHKVIPCMISSTKSRNNYQPTIVDGNDAKRVLKKIPEVK